MTSRLRTHTSGLSPHQAELIKKTSITPDQVFANMDALNQEIAETYTLPEDVQMAKPQEELVAARIKKPQRSTGEQKMNIDDLETSLDEELKAAEKLLQAKQKEQEEAKAAEPEQEQMDPMEQQKQLILDLLSKTKGAPNLKQIEALKQKYDGSLHVLALGEGDVYLFTHLRRGQWQKIQKLVQADASSNVSKDPNELLKEKVVQYTVVWPKVASPEFLYNSRAGVIDTLYETILLHSYFLTPQQAMMLTAQL